MNPKHTGEEIYPGGPDIEQDSYMIPYDYRLMAIKDHQFCSTVINTVVQLELFFNKLRT